MADAIRDLLASSPEAMELLKPFLPGNRPVSVVSGQLSVAEDLGVHRESLPRHAEPGYRPVSVVSGQLSVAESVCRQLRGPEDSTAAHGRVDRARTVRIYQAGRRSGVDHASILRIQPRSCSRVARNASSPGDRPVCSWARGRFASSSRVTRARKARQTGLLQQGGHTHQHRAIVRLKPDLLQRTRSVVPRREGLNPITVPASSPA